MVCTLGAKSDTQAESALRGFRSAVRARQANASAQTQQKRKKFRKGVGFGPYWERRWQWCIRGAFKRMRE